MCNEWTTGLDVNMQFDFYNGSHVKLFAIKDKTLLKHYKSIVI